MAFNITKFEKEAIADMYEWALKNSHSFFFIRCFQRTHLAKIETKLNMEWEARWMVDTDSADRWESHQVGPFKTLQELRLKMTEHTGIKFSKEKSQYRTVNEQTSRMEESKIVKVVIKEEDLL